MTENEKTIKTLCEGYGISQTELHRRFDIPLRTVQDWYAGRRKPPAYVVNMLTALLEHDQKVQELKRKKGEHIPKTDRVKE